MNDKLQEELLQLIEGCKKDNRKAQHRLFKLSYSSMLNVCMRYASNSDEAQDMLNEGYLKIFSNLDKYENTGSLESWMKRVMANAAVDYQRKYKTTVEMTNFDLISENLINTYNNNDALNNLTGQELMQLIQKLPNTSRSVFNLYIFENYSHHEIAELLNIKEGTSHWHLNFARNKLKQEIISLYGNDNKQTING